MIKKSLLIVIVILLQVSTLFASPNLESYLESHLKKELNCEKVDVRILKIERDYVPQEIKNVHLIGRNFEKTPILLELIDGTSKTIMCQIKAYDRVYFTKKPLIKGQKIDYEDVYYNLVAFKSIPQGAIKDIENIVKKEITRNVGTGIAITNNMIIDQELVKKGQKVNIVVERNSIRISAKGELQNNATIGSYVKAINYVSKKVVTGKLVDNNTVVMDY